MCVGTDDAEEDHEQADHGKHYDYAEEEVGAEEFGFHVYYPPMWLSSGFKRQRLTLEVEMRNSCR
jgi:hypothetical protein